MLSKPIALPKTLEKPRLLLKEKPKPKTFVKGLEWNTFASLNEQNT
jgi:hypothetical protein